MTSVSNGNNSSTAFEKDMEEAMAINNSPRDDSAENNLSSEEKASHIIDWNEDPENPLNWPSWKKTVMVVMLSSTGLLSSMGTSIISPALTQFEEEFNVTSTVAILPLTLYVLALGFGPVIGGPLSETVGRYPVYVLSVPLGALFTLGVGFTHNLGALCFLRFLAGFCWAPSLAVATGSLSETFSAKSRGPVVAIFILMPFLGPGLGPVIGSFVVHRKGWRWTQWTLIFFSILCMIILACTRETFHPVIKRRLAKKRGQEVPKLPPLVDRLKTFAVVALIRPLRMTFTEPIVGFICLYVAVEFGTLYTFFAAVPYTFKRVYGFGIEHSGLIFLSLVIGCFIGLFTILLCDIFVYRKQVLKYSPLLVPPEHRLYPAMIGSFGIPVGLFWYAWTARSSIPWPSPAAAIILFSWGNICLFVSTMQYLTDTYHGNVVASAAAANSLARYAFAAVFPLFTLQMYERLGVGWASSLLGFISLALLPIPWVLFKFGPKIRRRSQYETVLTG